MREMNIPAYLRNFDWHPGEFIADEMEALGYNQKELAERLGISAKVMCDLLKHKTRITPDYAQMLSRVLDRSADYWISLENNWTESQKRKQENTELLAFKDWIAKFYAKYLEENGIIPAKNDLPERIRELMKFFRIADPKCIYAQLSRLSAEFRKRETKNGTPEGRFVWISVGRRIIELQNKGESEFDKRKFKSMLKHLRENICNENELDKRTLQVLFDSVGVSLIFVPKIKNNEVYGAAYWHCGRPVIQMACYYAADDRFWFNLFHEAGHVLEGNKSVPQISFEDAESEAKADYHDVEILLPSSEFDAYMKKNVKHAKPTKSDIISCARAFNVPESIIVGRMQFLKILPVSSYRSMKKRVVFESDIPSAIST